MRDLLLGLNLWVVVGVVPIVARPFAQKDGLDGAFLVASLVAAGALALFVEGRRRRSAALLLGVFPAALGVAAAIARPSDGGPPAAVALGLALGAPSLFAYLGALALSLAQLDTASAAGLELRPLPGAIPPRWRRRRRVYGLLAATAGLLPLFLVAELYLVPGVVRLFDATYGGEASRVRMLGTVALALLSVFLFRTQLIPVLDGHLQQDRATLRQMAEARQQAKSGRPRPGFYLAVLVALLSMAALVLERMRP
jgi:hypothetical protein